MASVGNDGQGYFIDETGTRLPEEEILWNNDADFRDVDLDGDSDMFVVNVFPGENAYDALYINDGSGAFIDRSNILPRVLDFTASCALGDVDGDSDDDFVTANASPSYEQTDGQDKLYLNMFSADVNNDGQIDVSDVLLCVNIIIRLYEPYYPEFLRADYNADGAVNVLDVVGIVRKILESG